MSMPPMGVARGVAPSMGVAPTMGVAPPRPMPGPAGVSSHRDFPRLLPGVAATAGVSPGAHPGVAPPSACSKEHGHSVCQSHIGISLLRHAETQVATPLRQQCHFAGDKISSNSNAWEKQRTRPGVGVASSQRFRRGVASVPARPGVGVASQRLCPGVSPGVAPPPRPGVAPNSSTRPGVASHRPTAGVASVVSHSDIRAFLLHGDAHISGLCCHAHYCT